MRFFIVAVLFLTVFAASGAAQDKPRTDGDHEVRSCAPKVISGRSRKSPNFHLRKGEKYRHSRVVRYDILDSGDIAHAVLKRSSGVAEVDNYALAWVKGLKFDTRPGCAVVQSTADITIDFR